MTVFMISVLAVACSAFRFAGDGTYRHDRVFCRCATWSDSRCRYFETELRRGVSSAEHYICRPPAEDWVSARPGRSLPTSSSARVSTRELSMSSHWASRGGLVMDRRRIFDSRIAAVCAIKSAWCLRCGGTHPLPIFLRSFRVLGERVRRFRNGRRLVRGAAAHTCVGINWARSSNARKNDSSLCFCACCIRLSFFLLSF